MHLVAVAVGCILQRHRPLGTGFDHMLFLPEFDGHQAQV
jgi:hypothetical protein